MNPRLALAAIVAAALIGGPAQAEQRASTGSGRDATEIVAGQGIEWQRDKRVYIARGGVVVTRGETVLQADNMVAYYREGGGKSKVFRIDATGHVTMRQRDSVASGDRGVYDLDNKVVTLTGSNLSYVAPNSKVTARDSLEYWDEKRMAVARGKASAVNEDDILRADILVAYFNDKPGPDDKTPAAPPGPDAKKPDGTAADPPKRKKNEVVRYEGYGNVVVEPKDNVARGEHLIYDAKSKKAVLTSSGGTGVTHTPGGPPPPAPAPGALDGRVTGTFTPKSNDDDKNGADKPAADPNKKKPIQPKDGAAKPQ